MKITKSQWKPCWKTSFTVKHKRKSKIDLFPKNIKNKYVLRNIFISYSKLKYLFKVNNLISYVYLMNRINISIEHEIKKYKK